jgi:hypothetical protein
MEALVILIVPIVAFFVWLVARLQTDAMRPTPGAELARLEQYVAWLEDRRRHAEASNYDDQMKEHILGELWQASEQLDALREQLGGCPAKSVAQTR